MHANDCILRTMYLIIIQIIYPVDVDLWLWAESHETFLYNSAAIFYQDIQALYNEWWFGP